MPTVPTLAGAITHDRKKSGRHARQNQPKYFVENVRHRIRTARDKEITFEARMGKAIRRCRSCVGTRPEETVTFAAAYGAGRGSRTPKGRSPADFESNPFAFQTIHFLYLTKSCAQLCVANCEERFGLVRGQWSEFGQRKCYVNQGLAVLQ